MAHVGTAFSCSKCHNNQYETEEIRTTGKYSRFFDMQNKKYTAVSCTQCGYTELFRVTLPGWAISLTSWPAVS